MSFQRAFPRVGFYAPVKVVPSGKNSPIGLFAANLSQGGIFVRSNRPLPVGTRLALEFMTSTGVVKVPKGEVIWTKGAESKHVLGVLPGMGIQFLRVPDKSKKRIQAIVDERLKAKLKSLPPQAITSLDSSVPSPQIYSSPSGSIIVDLELLKDQKPQLPTIRIKKSAPIIKMLLQKRRSLVPIAIFLGLVIGFSAWYVLNRKHLLSPQPANPNPFLHSTSSHVASPKESPPQLAVVITPADGLITPTVASISQGSESPLPKPAALDSKQPDAGTDNQEPKNGEIHKAALPKGKDCSGVDCLTTVSWPKFVNHEGKWQLEFPVSAAVKVKYFFLNEPPRMVIDFLDTRFTGLENSLNSPTPFLSSIRVGLQPGFSRFVLDFKQTPIPKYKLRKTKNAITVQFD